MRSEYTANLALASPRKPAVWERPSTCPRGTRETRACLVLFVVATWAASALCAVAFCFR
jgi:hypothetical protein